MKDFYKSLAPGSREAPQYPNKQLIMLVRTLFVVILTAFIILDLLYHRKFMRLSCGVSLYLQTNLGPIAAAIALTFSYGIIFIPIVVPLIQLFNPRNFDETQTYAVQIFTSLILTNILKAWYGRGRPVIIEPGLEPLDCPCDYGMPSGHSSVSIILFHLAAHWMTGLMDLGYKRTTFQSSDGVLEVEGTGKSGRVNQNDLTQATSLKNGFITFLRYLCYLCAIAIGWSRIQLGAHAWSQVFCGYSVSLLVIIYLTQDALKSIFDYLQEGKRALAYSGICFVVMVGVYSSLSYLDYTRRIPEEWKFWSRCPKCDSEFWPKQLKDTTTIFLLPGLLLGYAVHFRNPLPKAYIYPKKSCGVFAKRVIYMVLMLIPVVFVAGAVGFLISIAVPMKDPRLRDAMFFGFAGIVLNIGLGALVAGGIHVLWKRQGVAFAADFYDKMHGGEARLTSSSISNDDHSGDMMGSDYRMDGRF